MFNEREYYKKYYEMLLGAKIVHVDGGAEFPAFTIKTPEGFEFTLEVSQDPECNGPGFLYGLPRPA